MLHVLLAAAEETRPVMEEIVWSDIPRCLTAVAEWGSCFLLLLLLKRKHSAVRFGLISAAAFAVLLVCLMLTDGLQTFAWVAAMIGAASET